MRVWTIANQKGGAGKSTLAINLSVYAEMCGEMTALIDTDPHGSVSGLWHEKRGTNKPMVVAASPDKLKDIIQAAKDFKVSLVIIDTQGHSDASIVEAVALSDFVICPSQSSLFDLAGIRDTAKVLLACEALGKSLAVVNNVPHQKAEQTFSEAAGYMEKYGFKVAPCFIKSRRSYQKSLMEGKAVCDFKPVDGEAKKEIEDLWSHINMLCPILSPKEKAAAE